MSSRCMGLWRKSSRHSSFRYDIEASGVPCCPCATASLCTRQEAELTPQPVWSLKRRDSTPCPPGTELAFRLPAAPVLWIAWVTMFLIMNFPPYYCFTFFLPCPDVIFATSVTKHTRWAKSRSAVYSTITVYLLLAHSVFTTIPLCHSKRQRFMSV
jgi:hypothetical protein